MSLEPTEEDIKNIETCIPEIYKASAFEVCDCQSHPTFHGDHIQINVKNGAKSSANQISIPALFRWSEKVKAQIDRDERYQVIERVPSDKDTT